MFTWFTVCIFEAVSPAPGQVWNYTVVVDFLSRAVGELFKDAVTS